MLIDTVDNKKSSNKLRQYR